MKHFEERLERLERLGEAIRKPDIPLNEALKSFEEGSKLARSLEKDLEKMESRIEVLMNGPEAKAEAVRLSQAAPASDGNASPADPLWQRNPYEAPRQIVRGFWLGFWEGEA